MNNSSIRKQAFVALCAAMSFALMYFSFGVPFISPFAEFDLSGIPELIGGFILGPAAAVEIITVKILLKLVFQGSSSLMTGEIQNFILSVAYVVPAAWWYKKHKTKHGAMIGIIIGTVISVVLSVFTNVYMIFPAYMFLYGMDWEMIIGMCSAAAPWIKGVPTMVAFSILPFNIISRTITSVITVLVYKKLSVPIKKLIQ